MSQKNSGKIKEVFSYFFKLGFIAFGGPAAHVALIQQELVENRKWMNNQEFLDYLGATNLIPGPNSTEMTMHCGYHRAGPLGLFVAGLSFIIPAVAITLIIAMFYEKYSSIEWLVPIINSIKAAVLAFILAAIYKLGKKAVKTKYLLLIGIVTFLASLFGLNEIIAILAAGLISILVYYSTSNKVFSDAGASILVLSTVAFSNLKLFLSFLKVGLVLFGSGYVLFAYLEGEFIDQLGWLTHSDLVEAIAIGQVTPGPILSTATFIGYKMGGVQGAILATVGIFGPSFFYALLLHKFLKKMQSSKVLKVFLDSVNVAAVAVMVAVTFNMARSILLDINTVIIAVLTCVVYFKYSKINALWIIISAALLGYILNIVL
ncbi:MAG: chromate efflux transporter [Saprospiraceae bacterium]|jgi:chromate transporter